MVVRAFSRLAVAGHIIVMGRIHERLFPAGQNLVRVTLVRDIEDNLVNGGVEHIMQSHSRLHHSEVRADVASVIADLVDQIVPGLICKNIELVDVQLLDVGRAVDFFEIHIKFVYYLLWQSLVTTDHFITTQSKAIFFEYIQGGLNVKYLR